ncbi:hypothetical protein GOC18_24640 [Sinorhizobium meliloti]|nr:hypothetical protein [Sinorhizobium meliloti]
MDRHHQLRKKPPNKAALFFCLYARSSTLPGHGRGLLADSDEAAPLFRDDCAPGFRDDLAPCLVGSAGDDCCQFIQARCQALRGRFRRRLSPLNSMRWALWTNLSSMASA